MSKRTKIIIAVVVLVVIAAAATAFALRAGGGGPEIETATVAETNLGVTVSASGKIQAGSRADMYPPTAGTLAVVYVSDGATVTAGQKIAKMDTGPLELAVRQAQAGLSQAQAAYDNVDAQGVSSADVTAARANVTATKKAWESAKKAAAAVEGPTDGQIDAAKASKDAAYQSYKNASDGIRGGRRHLRVHFPDDYGGALREEERVRRLPRCEVHLRFARRHRHKPSSGVRQRGRLSGVRRVQGRAGIAEEGAGRRHVQFESRRASRGHERSQGGGARAEQPQRRHALRAPIDGTVFFNATGAPGADGKTPLPAAGAAVAPQAAPFSVVDLGGSTFIAEVDEADIDRVNVGMEADVTLDSFPGETFSTKVTHISSAAQPTATGGTIFPVELAMTDTSQSILIGMKGDATVKVSSIPSALTIPLEALFNENGTNFVYKVDGGTKLVKTTITIGAQTDTDVEVIEGLKKGDVVALASPTTYTDGMTVTVKN